jgi:hypothetical protein
MEGISCGLIEGRPTICLAQQTKTMRKFSQDSRFVGLDSNPVPLEYEAGVLNTWP